MSRSSVLWGHGKAPKPNRESEVHLWRHDAVSWALNTAYEELHRRARGGQGSPGKQGTMSKASRPESVCPLGSTQQFWVAYQNHGKGSGVKDDTENKGRVWSKELMLYSVEDNGLWKGWILKGSF